MRQVCKDVGWDGQGFYCMRCGKAGFQTEAQARGHLAQCKGRSMARGVFPSPPLGVGALRTGCCEQVLPPAGGIGGAPAYPLGGAGGAGGGQAASFYPPQATGYPSYWYGDLDSRIRHLENEYNHMLIQRNVPQQDWLGGLFQNKGLVILCLVLFVSWLIGQVGQCRASDEPSSKGMGSLGEKALTKLTDRAITKSVDSLFR